MGESLDWVSADPVANGFVFSGRPQGSPCFLWAGSDTPVRVRENLLKGADWLGRDPRRG